MAVNAARVKSLFLTASDLGDPAERVAYLDRECDGDAELRDRVEALLRANDASPLPPDDVEDVTRMPAPVDQSQTEDHGDPTARVGSIVGGKYKLIEEIGAGGMGSVYMAQQTEPVKRAVAVKVIKAGMDSRAVLARFEAERQALALMDHPNIAKVLDAGTTDGGRPFFVMELVKGVPITQFCDECKLTPRRRLELFIPVCQAIQHAHQKGIIHRDIKPSNVLIALYDDRPVPKVIDFGVAKATGQTLTELTLMTGFGAVVGTPEYMSPEQASLNNLDIDTRSDVYSLGVLLYELLTGSTPVDRKSLGKAALLEILRLVREVEAPRPSARLSSIDTPASVAANRSTEPAKLSNVMKGELDWVVLKALEKDRTRRYDTANGLARDIQRYLADELVEARPPSAGYRLKKFVSRYKGQVTAAALVLLVLVAGVIGTSTALLWADAERKRALGAEADALASEGRAVAREKQEIAARQEAERQKRTAEAVSSFLRDVLRQGDPDWQMRSRGEANPNLTLRQAIDRAAARVEGRFRDQPLIEADVRLTLGYTYVGIGAYAPAIPQLRRAVALRREHLGRTSAETLTAISGLARALASLDQLKEALALCREVVEVKERTLGLAHPDTLHAVGSLANVHIAMRDSSAAEVLLLRNLEAARTAYGANHLQTAHSLMALGRLYTESKSARAGSFLRDGVAALRNAYPPTHPHLLDAVVAAGYFALQVRKLDEAEGYFREAYDGRRKLYNENHPSTSQVIYLLAEVKVKRGEAALRRGDRAEGVRLMETAVAEARQKIGDRHWRPLFIVYMALGPLLYHNQTGPAEALSRDLLTALERTPQDDWFLHFARILLGRVLLHQKRHQEAEPLLVGGYKGLIRCRATISPRLVFEPKFPEIVGAVAKLYAGCGRPAEAVPLIDEFLQLTANKVVDPALGARVLINRLRCCENAADPAGCRATAEMWEKLNRSKAGDLYDAACMRAVAASIYAKKDQPKEAATDADRAMVWLIKAVKAGYRNAAHMKKDPDLDALRDREDFKKLAAELEKKAVKK